MSEAIVTALKALKLHGMAANYPEVAAQARHTEFSPEAFLGQFGQATGLDTSAIGRISPPWTYQLLAAVCTLMLAGELAVGLWQLNS